MRRMHVFFALTIAVMLILGACNLGVASPPPPATDAPVEPSQAPAATEPPVLTEVPVASPTIIPIDLSGPPMERGSKFTYVDGNVIVAVPSGQFVMGYGGDDNPEHTVNTSDFWIYRAKVTNAQYALCLRMGQCSAPDANDNPGFPDPLTRQPHTALLCMDGCRRKRSGRRRRAVRKGIFIRGAMQRRIATWQILRTVCARPPRSRNIRRDRAFTRRWTCRATPMSGWQIGTVPRITVNRRRMTQWDRTPGRNVRCVRTRSTRPPTNRNRRAVSRTTRTMPNRTSGSVVWFRIRPISLLIVRRWSRMDRMPSRACRWVGARHRRPAPPLILRRTCIARETRLSRTWSLPVYPAPRSTRTVAPRPVTRQNSFVRVQGKFRSRRIARNPCRVTHPARRDINRMEICARRLVVRGRACRDSIMIP